VVRHPLVQRIVEAYERYDNRMHGKLDDEQDERNA
jgi:phosphate starvation-inducible PhoH-like protein